MACEAESRVVTFAGGAMGFLCAAPLGYLTGLLIVLARLVCGLAPVLLAGVVHGGLIFPPQLPPPPDGTAMLVTMSGQLDCFWSSPLVVEANGRRWQAENKSGRVGGPKQRAMCVYERRRDAWVITRILPAKIEPPVVADEFIDLRVPDAGGVP